MEELVHLLKLDKDALKEELYKRLSKIGMSPVNEEGYLYAKGDIPVLLVAHMDTVFDEPPRMVEYYKEYDMLYNPEGGLGGDDRCGIYAILKLLENCRPHVLFTEDEEIGCIGAMNAAWTLPKPDVKYIIEFDRRGSKDCVFYECGNLDFMDYVEGFGFKTDYGTFTDISILGEEWDIAAVNLSSGYYNEHKPEEFIVFSDLLKTIKRVEAMIDKIEYAPYYDHQTIVYKPSNCAVVEYDDKDGVYLNDYFDNEYDFGVQSSQEQSVVIDDSSSKEGDNEGPRLLLEMKNNEAKK